MPENSVAEKIVLCHSGGKDSILALYELLRQKRYDVVSLITTVTDDFDRISMHGVRRSLLYLQTRSLGIPLHEVSIAYGANNADYEQAMSAAFDEFRQKGIRKIAFGDIFLEDLKQYRQQHLARHEMTCLFPIWKRDTRTLIDSFLKLGFRAVTVCIDLNVLDESFAGREIDERFVNDLPAGADPCGENGEFHTFVFDGPLFEQKISFSRGETVRRDSFLFCDLLSEDHTEPAETLGAKAASRFNLRR